MTSPPLLASLLPAAMIIATGLVPAFAVLYLYKRRIRHKKSPLNMDLLRNPGESLREQVDAVGDEILERFVALCVIPVCGCCAILSQQVFSGRPPGMAVLMIFIGFTAGLCIWQGRHIYRLLLERNRLRLGYDCELAVGQRLSLLARQGYHLFHDFPAKTFNIDHIAVGPHGVFAIETKGRAKPAVKEKDNWHLRFDGSRVYFSGSAKGDAEPAEQANRQAVWLARWIENLTKEVVPVIPVLAFPDWFIDLPGNRTFVRICNGKNFSFLTRGQIVLTEIQVERIAALIEKECRKVMVRAYQG